MSTAAHTAIINAIPTAFDAAKASGDLLFFDSEIRHHRDRDLNVRAHPVLSCSSAYR